MPRNDPNSVPTRFLDRTGVELLAPQKSGTAEREPRPASPRLIHHPSHQSEQLQPHGWHTHRPEKTRKRSLRKFFKHVRVGIHEVNSNIDGTLRLLRRLNNDPRPVVLQDRDRLPRPVHLCCHPRKVVLRLGEPHSQCRHAIPFSPGHNYGQNLVPDQATNHSQARKIWARHAHPITKHRPRPTIQGRGRGYQSASSARYERHSHSMVAGGLEVTSRTTRLTSGTELVMRVEMRARTS